MSHPFLSIGFRPFYLGAAIFATVAIPYWLATFLGGASGGGPFAPVDWHIHEMLFGFAPAVIVGFLLTAVRNWSGRPTLSGAGLATLCTLWVAGRVAAFVGGGTVGAFIDLCFLPIAAASLAKPLLAAGNRRNLFVIGILLALFIANLAFYGAALGWVSTLETNAAYVAALNVISILLVVIAGRVIPAFSSNAVPSIVPKRWQVLEIAAIGMIVVIAVADLMASSRMRVPEPGYQLLLLCATGLHLLRLWAWQPWKTWRNPLLLVLPLSYLWIPAYLLLRGILPGSPGEIPSAAVHALVVGAMSGLMLSMMTRSALGHTGRPLRAGGIEITCFIAVHAAALIRVPMVLLEPRHYATWLMASAILWSIAFGTFAAGYLQVLAGPRRDQTLPGAARSG